MKISIARVFHGGGRRFLTLKAACNKEALSRVMGHMVKRDGYYEPENYNPALVARVARLMEREHKRITP